MSYDLGQLAVLLNKRYPHLEFKPMKQSWLRRFFSVNQYHCGAPMQKFCGFYKTSGLPDGYTYFGCVYCGTVDNYG